MTTPGKDEANSVKHRHSARRSCKDSTWPVYSQLPRTEGENKEHLEALKKTEAKDIHRGIFGHLYTVLTIIDTKSASLLQFDSILIAVYSIFLVRTDSKAFALFWFSECSVYFYLRSCSWMSFGSIGLQQRILVIRTSISWVFWLSEISERFSIVLHGMGPLCRSWCCSRLCSIRSFQIWIYPTSLNFSRIESLWPL